MNVKDNTIFPSTNIKLIKTIKQKFFKQKYFINGERVIRYTPIFYGQFNINTGLLIKNK